MGVRRPALSSCSPSRSQARTCRGEKVPCRARRLRVGLRRAGRRIVDSRPWVGLDAGDATWPSPPFRGRTPRRGRRGSRRPSGTSQRMFGQTRSVSAGRLLAAGAAARTSRVRRAVAEASTSSASLARDSVRARVEEYDGLAGMERPELGILGAQADRGIQLAEPFLGSTRDTEELAEERARDRHAGVQLNRPTEIHEHLVALALHRAGERPEQVAVRLHRVATMRVWQAPRSTARSSIRD